MSKRILIVEDDTSLARLLHDNLEYEGFVVERARDGREAIAKAESFRPELVLLDLMLPGMDGFEICRWLNEEQPRLPIIILTAKTAKEDKVRGLDLGADDYVTKPFALEELLARVHAVLRRSPPRRERLVLGDVVVDFRSFEARRGDSDLRLTHREFELLHHLAEREGDVVTREELLRLVWRYNRMSLTRTVDISIARLRRKIEPDPHHPRYLHTAHGDGYFLTLATAR